MKTLQPPCVYRFYNSSIISTPALVTTQVPIVYSALWTVLDNSFGNTYHFRSAFTQSTIFPTESTGTYTVGHLPGASDRLYVFYEKQIYNMVNLHNSIVDVSFYILTNRQDALDPSAASTVFGSIQNTMSYAWDHASAYNDVPAGTSLDMKPVPTAAGSNNVGTLLQIREAGITTLTKFFWNQWKVVRKFNHRFSPGASFNFAVKRGSHLVDFSEFQTADIYPTHLPYDCRIVLMCCRTPFVAASGQAGIQRCGIKIGYYSTYYTSVGAVPKPRVDVHTCSGSTPWSVPAVNTNAGRGVSAFTKELVFDADA